MILKGPLTLAKLHGAGNDFLVVIDPDGVRPIGAALARALCDRHRGVGADGVLRALAPTDGGDLRMELHNADGSVAETSGNGLRCLALAALEAGMVAGERLAVETSAGVRQVEVRGRTAGAADIAVGMGTVELAAGDADPPGPGWRARRASVGNPHLVILVPAVEGFPVAEVGKRIDSAEPGGMNVEVIGPPATAGLLDLVVWERGAGVTLACGSGSCAAAAAARLWGLCDDSVTVSNPGGELFVELSGADPLAPQAVLSGPARHVATVTVDLEALLDQDRARAGSVA